MFQWAKIWIALFYPLRPIGIKDDAERLLSELEDLNSETAVEKLVDAYHRLLEHNAPPKHLTERLYMIRAYRLLLCCREPWTCDTLCQAVSIRSNGTLDESVTPKLVRSWCFNLFKISRRGFFEISHDSAKQFLRDFANLETLDGSRQDFSLLSCNSEMAELCLQVMSKQTHCIWKKRDFWYPTPRESLWWQHKLIKNLERCSEEFLSSRHQLIYSLMVNEHSEQNGFGAYVCLFWIWHCMDATANNPMFISKLSSLLNPESAFNSWALFILTSQEIPNNELRKKKLVYFLKLSVIDSLAWAVDDLDDVVEGNFCVKSSLLHFLACFDMLNYTIPPETLQDNQSGPHINWLKRSLQDLDSTNVFGQTTAHIAARYRFQESLKCLVQSKGCEGQESLFDYLRTSDQRGRTALHRAVDQDSFSICRSKDPTSVVRYIVSSLGDTSEPLRTKLLGIKDNHSLSALDVFVQDFDRQRSSYITNDIWTASWFSTVYDLLVTGSPPLLPATKVALLKTLLTRGDLKAFWAEELYTKIISQDPEFEESVEKALFDPYETVMCHFCPGSKSIMALIIKKLPGILRKPDPFELTLSEMLRPIDCNYPLSEANFARLNFLLQAEKEHFGRRKRLSTWYREFVTCYGPLHNPDGVYLPTEAECLLLKIEPDLGSPDENGAAPLHYFGHNWSRCGSRRHESSTCSFIFTFDLIKLLVTEHGKLFILHADGTLPFSTILKRIGNHIGFLAYLLWDKPSDETDLFPRGNALSIINGTEIEAGRIGTRSTDYLTIGEERQASHDYFTALEQPALLKFLRLYCEHSYSKNTSEDRRFLFRELCNTSKTFLENERDFEVEECLSLQDFHRYEQELDAIQAKWIEVRDIAKTSWQKVEHGGINWCEWQEGTDWVEKIAGKDEFSKMRNFFQREEERKR